MSYLSSFLRLFYALCILLPFIFRFVRNKSNRPLSLAKALNRLGPSWVKLGQFLATRPDIVGQSISDDLRSLQDRMTPFPTSRAKLILEQSLGKKLESVFSEFSDPIAAASIAQVHKAKIAGEDREVAVKIIRPGVRRRFKRDLRTFYHAAYLITFLFPSFRRLQLIASLDVLARSATMEMDLRLEASALSEMSQNIEEDEGFRVPQVEWDYSKRDCLTMEWIDGIKLTDHESIFSKLNTDDRIRLANTLNQSFLRHTLRDGFFHADMHQGNLFVDSSGTIVAVDMGIVGRLTPSEQKFLGEVLLGFIMRDYARIAQIHFDQGYVPADQDMDAFAQALRAVGEPIHGQDSHSISMGHVLSLLFEITDLFNMETQPRLLLLQKTMVVVEGVSRFLDPDFNMWESAKPVVVPLMARMLGPVGAIEDVTTGLKSLKSLVRLAPQMARHAQDVSQIMDDTIHNGLPLNPRSITELHARGRWYRASMLLIGLSIISILGYHWL